MSRPLFRKSSFNYAKTGMELDRGESEGSLQQDLDSLPKIAGVYLMKDKQGEIIYVGKAVNLYNRVRSYFVGRKDLKTELLRRRVARVEVSLCANQYQALVLEDNLIKKHQPHYNIQLKDDKSFPLLRLTADSYPRIFSTRHRIEDGSTYYGPFPDGKKLHHYLELIHQLFRLRRCSGKLPQRKNPCLYYHTKHCDAPCVNKISAAEYQHQVQRLKTFLSGKTSTLERELKKQMKEASDNLEYETAARFRDMLKALQELLSEQQNLQDFSDDKCDYLALMREHDWCFFTILHVREGRMLGSENFRCQYPGEDYEAVSEFILDYYTKNEVPEKLYLEKAADYEHLCRFIAHKYRLSFQILVAPKSQHERVLLERAVQNAEHQQTLWLQRHGDKYGLNALREALQLPRLPNLIEGFDISHNDGRATVAALVSFVDGQAAPKNYRYLRIKSLEERKIDDYQAMREAVARRYTRLLNESQQLPDLILIDGGLGQVNAAAQILKDLELEIPLVSLAKRHEWLFRAGTSEPLVLEKRHFGLRLLQRVRDEAHRFSNNFTRRNRNKQVKLRSLESVPGIGPKRSAQLLATYGSLAAIARCSQEQLCEQSGLSPMLAATLKHYLEIWLEKPSH